MARSLSTSRWLADCPTRVCGRNRNEVLLSSRDSWMADEALVDGLSIRDTAGIDALSASYFARQLHGVITDTAKTIATEELPLARIKRIMKQDSCDPHPRMISADAVPLMAFATKLFIGHLSTVHAMFALSAARRSRHAARCTLSR